MAFCKNENIWMVLRRALTRCSYRDCVDYQRFAFLPRSCQLPPTALPLNYMLGRNLLPADMVVRLQDCGTG